MPGCSGRRPYIGGQPVAVPVSDMNMVATSVIEDCFNILLWVISIFARATEHCSKIHTSTSNFYCLAPNFFVALLHLTYISVTVIFWFIQPRVPNADPIFSDALRIHWIDNTTRMKTVPDGPNDWLVETQSHTTQAWVYIMLCMMLCRLMTTSIAQSVRVSLYKPLFILKPSKSA